MQRAHERTGGQPLSGIAGFRPEEVARAPLKPPPVSSRDVRTAQALQNPARRRYTAGNLLVLCGVAAGGLGVAGLVLLPAFPVPLAWVLAGAGSGAILCGILTRALQFLPH